MHVKTKSTFTWANHLSWLLICLSCRCWSTFELTSMAHSKFKRILYYSCRPFDRFFHSYKITLIISCRPYWRWCCCCLPDHGGVTRATKTCSMFSLVHHCPRRSVDKIDTSELWIIGNVEGSKTCYLDDMIDTANLICHAARCACWSWCNSCLCLMLLTLYLLSGPAR